MKICPVCSTEYPNDVKFCPNDGQTLRPATPAGDLVGQVVADRYHVTKKLGEGGMGQVYLAEHVKMGRRSAIKVMNPAMVHDPDAIARFNREASNASRITHPNVCAIYDFGETPDGLIYLAMEFIEGEPLTDLLAREGALPLPRAVNIFLQVADALQVAHELGIVHRDLKPDNIMVAPPPPGRRAGSDIVKVVDFGIAKAVGGDQAGQKVTKTGLVVGTPEFMSPEQLSGDALDGRSDLYSLALVLFRMLTGKLPFEGGTAQETMVNRLTDEPIKLAAASPDVAFPPGLQPVLDTALARVPAERYQTVAKFAADIAAVAGRPGPPAVPATRPAVDTEGKTQLLKTARQPTRVRKRSFIPVVVGVVVILAGAGAWFALNGGSKAGGAVSLDTAGNKASRQIADSGPRLATRRPAPPAPPPVRSNTSRTRTLDVNRVADSLNKLFERIDSLSGIQLRDAAVDLYNMEGISNKNRALAAYLAANGWVQLHDSGNTCAWARRAVNLDRQRAYATLQQHFCPN